MTDSQHLLLIVALQLGLFGLAWMAAALYLPEGRAGFRDFLGFSVLAGIGIALLAMRTLVPGNGGRALANVCVIVGLVLLWRGVAGMWRFRVPPFALYVMPAIGAAGALWSGFVIDSVESRISSFFLTCAWIVMLAPISSFQLVHAEFGRLAAWLLVGCGGSVGLVVMLRTLHSWRGGSTQELDLAMPGNFVPVVVLLVAISLVNFALGFGLIARMVRRLDHLSRHDALTGLLNRRALHEVVDDEWQRFRRHGGPFALLALDIDHFKRINDSHGHAMGDEVLRRLGALFKTTLRRTDRVGRTGGEEFVVMLVGDDIASAWMLAERLRQAVIAAPWPEPLGAQGGVTVSVGLVVSKTADTSLPALLERADKAPYGAKQGGRNRIVEA